MIEREYYECHCYSPEHTLQFWLDEDEPAMLYAYVFLNQDPWWKRIWNAVRYICGYKCRFGHYDEFLLHPKDCDRFIELLKRYKKVSEKYPTDEDLDNLR